MIDVYAWRSLDDAEYDGYRQAERDLDHEIDINRGQIQGLKHGLEYMERMNKHLMDTIAPAIHFPPVILKAKESP